MPETSTGRHGGHNPRFDPMVLGVARQCTPGVACSPGGIILTPAHRFVHTTHWNAIPPSTCRVGKGAVM
jgi:hypothetical protein